MHGNPTAARIWGISAEEYGEKADAWPLNPNGELLLGLKLEDKYALANAEANSKVPGVAFAEWGPGDMAFSLGVKNGPGPLPPAMQAARAKVLAATKANKIFFLNTMNADNVVDMIKEGVMIGAGQPAGRGDRPEVHQARDALVRIRNLNLEFSIERAYHSIPVQILQPRDRQPAVDVDDRAGRVRQVAAQQRRHDPADVVGLAPAALGDEAVGDAPVVDVCCTAAVMSVAMMPGRTSYTGMPCSASRAANSRAAIDRPALLTQ